MLLTGLFTWKGTLYYASPTGALKKKAGIVEVDGNSYYVAAGGAVIVDQKFTADGKMYISDEDGKLLKGFFIWGGTRHYADDDYSVYRSKMFTVGNSTYVANSSGNIATGVYKWGSAYYYADSTGVIDKTARMITYGGSYYYNNVGGGLSVDTWVNTGGRHYYAGTNAKFRTYNNLKKHWFHVKNSAGENVKIHPDARGVISDEEYNKARS